MVRLWTIGLALLLVGAPTWAQIFAPINQTYARKKRADLALRLSSSKPDSNRVYLLLGLANAYRTANAPDSALFYAVKAISLAHSLGMEESEGQGSFLACKANGMKGDMREAEVYVQRASGVWKMRMLQELDEHYSFRPGNLPANLDSAWPFIRRLVALTDTMHSQYATMNTRIVLAKYYYERGELRKGMDLVEQNIREAHLTGDKNLEAHWWSEFAGYIPWHAGVIDTVIKAEYRAMELFEQAQNHREAIFKLSDIAGLHCQLGQTQLAEEEQTHVIDELHQMGQDRMYNQYRNQAIYELYLGNHNLALRLMLMAKANMDSLKEEYAAGSMDLELAEVYWAEKDLDKSLYWYKIGLQEAEGRRDLVIYHPALHVVQGLIRKGGIKEAEQFLVAFMQNDPPVWPRDREAMALAWGNLFEAQGEDGKAEQKYLDMIRYANQGEEEAKRSFQEAGLDNVRAESQYTIGKYYVRKRQFAKAHPYLLAAIEPKVITPAPIEILRDAYELLFKVDSAAGNLASAIHDRLLYEKYADSISTVAKTREIAEIQAQYETAKKDQDIALLSKQAQLQKADISRSTILRNIIFGGLLVALLIIGLLYILYKSKQRNNKETARKNEVLSQLVREKEWLLKEVHHRVKNNLQMVVSLLDSQTDFLTSDALTAVRDSQNRVFSISLIHQKLYQDEDVARVNMASYLGELITYLRESYDIRNQIRFELAIAPLTIDISQAVRIGLILNEALTNSIKHAFPTKRTGKVISVIISVNADKVVDMTIADNGIGLPAGLDPPIQRSLGIKLMRGLTEELGGTISVVSENGATVHIRFVARGELDHTILSNNSETSTEAV